MDVITFLKIYKPLLSILLHGIISLPDSTSPGSWQMLFPHAIMEDPIIQMSTSPFISWVEMTIICSGCLRQAKTHSFWASICLSSYYLGQLLNDAVTGIPLMFICDELLSPSAFNDTVTGVPLMFVCNELLSMSASNDAV